MGMLTETLLIAIIFLLLGYIIILHIRIEKKNIFIESTVKRLSGIEKKLTNEEMISFLNEVKKMTTGKSSFSDKLFEEEQLAFLLENIKENRVYIHYTKNENDALNILAEGFRFADSFYKTALQVTDDKLDLLIKHNGKKSFGDFMVIICISRRIIDLYSSVLLSNGLRNFSVENVLTSASPYKNENFDMIYLLSPSFIKGFINHRTGIITPNPVFNPEYDSPLFKKNIELLATFQKII